MSPGYWLGLKAWLFETSMTLCRHKIPMIGLILFCYNVTQDSPNSSRNGQNEGNAATTHGLKDSLGGVIDTTS